MSNRVWRCVFALLLSTAAVTTVYGKEAPSEDSVTKPDQVVSKEPASEDDAAKAAHIVRYVIAAPRACLIDAPLWTAAIPWLPSGAAENFARADGALRVLTGTQVVFALGPGLEAVWYDHTYGTIATSLEVQLRPADLPDDSNDPNDQKDLHGQAATAAKRPAVEPSPWITLGVDGAKDTRKGPSIGHADVAVGVRFSNAGVYYLRGIVRTVVEPQYPQPVDHWRDRLSVTGAENLPDIPAEVDRDMVHVKVLVVDKPVANEEPNDPASKEPNADHTESLPKDSEGQNAPEAEL